MVDLTSDVVWNEMAAANFMVVGMVTARGEARTVGVMHAVHDGRVWFTTDGRSWKARHLAAHPRVSVTVAIPKRVPLMPWIKVPAATITFAGEAEFLPVEAMAPEVERALLHGLDLPEEELEALAVVAIRPTGDFITYGIGVSVLGMRNAELAHGRVAVGAGDVSAGSGAEAGADRTPADVAA
ncbi:pyridoxamine 5'-phosphate oxidase family protein [Agromyces sp. MMS24-K17]|uniref:pyridoxamine 5'-phosphate oxidase family protein n=1 Tax=Agromyces sp. MMS24-K17 TaxID=3372850 RepID=UPI003754E6B8